MANVEQWLMQNFKRVRTGKALILVDLQNDLVTKEGKYPTQDFEFLDRIQELVPAFRKEGSVIWVTTKYQQIDGEVPTQRDEESVWINDAELGTSLADRDGQLIRSLQKTLQAETSTKIPPVDDDFILNPKRTGGPCCLPGTKGSEMPDTMKALIDPGAGDIQLVKNTYSTFNGTHLLQTLRMKFITEIFICGAMSNASVFATVSDAARHGLSIRLVEDCLGNHRLDRHQEAIQQMVKIMGALKVTSKNLEPIASTEVTTAEPSPLPSPTTQPEIEPFPDFEHQHTEIDDEEEEESEPDIADLRAAIAGLRMSRTTNNRSADKGKGPAQREPSARRRSNESSASAEPQVVSRPTIRVPQRVQMKPRMAEKHKPKRDIKAEEAPPKRRSEPKDPDTDYESAHEYHESDMPWKPSGAEIPIKTTVPEVKTALVQDAVPHATEPPVMKNGFKPTADAASKRTMPTPPKKPDQPRKKSNIPSLATFPILGPADKIGEGDSKIIYDIFSQERSAEAPSTDLPASPDLTTPTTEDPSPNKPFADIVFNRLITEVQWQKMYHAAGEVPRLVAVQGHIDPEDSSHPIYRHPADQSPPLLPFTPTVDLVRKRVESLIGHKLNHCLIQQYRSGRDFISEHSDKTLDVARGSSIVNVSFGAQRTMRLRTKRDKQLEISDADKSKDSDEHNTIITGRVTQRIPLKHGSCFVMGLDTNMKWLHGIMADKRPETEKDIPEEAFGGVRVSLTFRHIGTFLDKDEKRIWGQGATGKSLQEAKNVFNGVEEETERLLRAFGRENQDSEFDWEEVYGGGFDVLHFRKEREEESKTGDVKAEKRYT